MQTEIKEKLIQQIEGERIQMLSSISDSLRIRSVREDAAGPDMPFGRGIAEAMEHVLTLCRGFGFRTKNCDGFAGWAEIGEGDEMIAVLAHLDVVPEGSGWSFPPYGGEIHEGRLYGRGVLDDKGPMMACIYGMKAIFDLGLPLHRRIRIIFGGDEETDWKCVKHYRDTEELPVMGFTPDADFPVIYGEKGILELDLVMNLPDSLDCQKDCLKIRGLGRITSLQGGTASNAVPDYCMAAGVLTAPNEDGCATDRDFFFEEFGIAAHASDPEAGENAIAKLLERLYARMKQEVDSRSDHTDRCDSDIERFLNFYHEKIGLASNGEQLGCGLFDDESGPLTLNAGVLRLSVEELRLRIDIRYPVTCSAQEIRSRIERETESFGIRIEVKGDEPPVYSDKNSRLVQTLMKTYVEMTGSDAEPRVMGAGTYARMMPNLVAFGPLFPGQEATAHQKDEYMETEHLMEIAKIYGLSIYDLAESDRSVTAPSVEKV